MRKFGETDMNANLFKGIQPAQPAYLASIVNGRPRQVVSLTLWRSGENYLTVFAFAEGEGISREVLDEDRLYLNLEGEMELDRENHPPERMPAGFAALIPAGHVHALDSLTPGKALVVNIDGTHKKQPDNIYIINKEKNMPQELIKNIDKAKAVNLKNIVDYEKDQVASLTLAQKDNLTLTVFAFDNNTGIGGHSSTGDAFVYILEGSAQITIGPDKHNVTAGQAIVMPAGIPHALDAVDGRFKMLLAVVKP